MPRFLSTAHYILPYDLRTGIFRISLTSFVSKNILQETLKNCKVLKRKTKGNRQTTTAIKLTVLQIKQLRKVFV